MKASKRIVAVLLTVLMTVSFMVIAVVPASAAENYAIWVNNVQFTSDNLTVACGSGTATYDAAGNTITLDNATFQNNHMATGTGYAVSAPIYSKTKDINIKLASDSTIRVNNGSNDLTYYAIYSGEKVSIDTCGHKLVAGIEGGSKPSCVIHGTEDVRIKSTGSKGTVFVTAGINTVDNTSDACGIEVGVGSSTTPQVYIVNTIVNVEANSLKNAYGVKAYAVKAFTGSQVDINARGSSTASKPAESTYALAWLNAYNSATAMIDQTSTIQLSASKASDGKYAKTNSVVYCERNAFSGTYSSMAKAPCTDLNGAAVEVKMTDKIAKDASGKALDYLFVGTRTLTYDANGGTGAPEPVSANGEITLSAVVPTYNGCTFKGWSVRKGGTTAQYQPGDPFTMGGSANTVLYAVWEKNSVTPSNPTASAVLTVGAGRTVDYKSTVTVVARATGVPAGYFVAIYDGDTQLVKGDNTTAQYTANKMTAGKTFTAKVVDANGAVQKDGSGADLAKNVEVGVKTGFFAKIAAFFRGIFGLLPKITIQP